MNQADMDYNKITPNVSGSRKASNAISEMKKNTHNQKKSESPIFNKPTIQPQQPKNNNNDSNGCVKAILYVFVCFMVGVMVASLT